MSCASWMGRTLLFRVASGTKLLGVSSNHGILYTLVYIISLIFLAVLATTLQVKVNIPRLRSYIIDWPSLHLRGSNWRVNPQLLDTRGCSPLCWASSRSCGGLWPLAKYVISALWTFEIWKPHPLPISHNSNIYDSIWLHLLFKPRGKIPWFPL